MKKLSDKTPTKRTKATGASLKPLAVGCIEDKTPSQQIFIGRLPGRPPQKKPIPTKPIEATGAPLLRPGPKGFVEVEGDSHIFVGGLPGKPPKKQSTHGSGTTDESATAIPSMPIIPKVRIADDSPGTRKKGA